MSDYAKIVLPIMREVRDIAFPHFGIAAIVGQKTESYGDMVTQLDIDVEKHVSSKLREHFPDIVFVGEESGGDRNAQRFWLMDPIDGTSHFVRGLPFCTSMLALIEDGQVNFSVIYDFVTDTMFWAERGKGAYRNEEQIHVSDRPLSKAYLCWETHLEVKENQEKWLKIFSKTAPFKTVCAGWEMTQIAYGKLDGRICFSPHGKDYDYAPGSLLISEAGGIVANIGKSTYDFQNTEFIASNPIIYKELTALEDAPFPLQ